MENEWETKIKKENLVVEMAIKFTASTMTIKSFTADLTSTWYCNKKITDDTFIMLSGEGDGKRYKCIQYNQISSYIIQLTESEANFSLSTDLCSVSSMVINDWPLVWSYSRTKFEPCTLVGGFDLQIFEDGKELCPEKTHPLRPRVEIECIHGDNIIFDFRDTYCIPNKLNIFKDTHGFCMGGWSLDNDTFMIFGVKATWWTHLWMLKYPKDHGDEFDAYILTDIIADRDKNISNSNYVKLTLKRRMYRSLCEDESQGCDSVSCPSVDDSWVCQKQCGNCSYLRTIYNCDFSNLSRGEWIENSTTGIRNIRVTRSLLYVDNLPTTECMGISAGGTSFSTNTKVLYATFKNGCKPRYSCVEFTSPGSTNAILKYRLSQNYIWPHKASLTKNDICNAQSFSNDPPPLLGQYRNAGPKYIVRTQSFGIARATTECNFPGLFVFSAKYQTGSGIYCNGTMSKCRHSNQIIMTFDEPCSGQPQRSIFTCLYTKTEFRKAVLITELTEDTNQIQCWNYEEVLSSTKDYKMYLLRTGDCSLESIDDIMYDGKTNYEAAFTFRKAAETVTDSCVPNTKTSTSTTTTTTTPTPITTYKTTILATTDSATTTETTTEVTTTYETTSTESLTSATTTQSSTKATTTTVITSTVTATPTQSTTKSTTEPTESPTKSTTKSLAKSSLTASTRKTLTHPTQATATPLIISSASTIVISYLNISFSFILVSRYFLFVR